VDTGLGLASVPYQSLVVGEVGGGGEGSGSLTSECWACVLLGGRILTVVLQRG
jgi:hypothetical protein